MRLGRVTLGGRLGQVSGAGAWTPALLTQRVWMRADDLITVGSDVDSWTDKTGNSNSFAAASAGVRPAYASTGFAGGSRPYVEFDGGSEWMRKTGFSWGGAVTAYTVWLVMHIQTVTVGRAFFQYGSYPNGTILAAGAVNHQGSGGVNSASTTSASSAARFVTYTWDGATQRVYVAGVQEDSDVNAGGSLADGATFGLGSGSGGTFNAHVRIAEMGAMRTVIAAADHAFLRAYVLARYGV